MSPDMRAQFLASLAVSAAEAYIAGRRDASALGCEADRLAEEVLTVSKAAADVPDGLRLLVVTMRWTSHAEGERQRRWCDVMAALCRLVRHHAVVLA